MRVKSAKSYGSKLGAIFVVYVLVWFLSTVLLIQIAEAKVTFHPAWLGLITFFILIIFLVRAFIKHYQAFKCPDCGDVIERPLKNSSALNEAIIYHCAKCDILWHVGDTTSG